jgi:hypothetical protein
MNGDFVNLDAVDWLITKHFTRHLPGLLYFFGDAAQIFVNLS